MDNRQMINLLNFYKNYFIIIIIIIILLYFFFMKIIFIFSCSGMFRDVPECSMFLVLSTPLQMWLNLWSIAR